MDYSTSQKNVLVKKYISLLIQKQGVPLHLWITCLQKESFNHNKIELFLNKT